MQSDVKSGMPETSQKTSYQEAEQEKNEIAAAKQKEVVSSAQKKLQGTHRPSSTAWHLILMAGDVILLVALFGLLLLFHMTPESATSTFGIREVQLMWVCLALVSWGLAVNMTQSQQLNYASN